MDAKEHEYGKRRRLVREALRRRDEVRSGKVKSIPATAVCRRIERLLAK